jgi:Resolvase, N terminal domain
MRSTTDQDLSIQEAALKAAGCEVIRAEKRSGTTTEGREALRTVLEFLHAGDVLMVTRIDRLARSIGDLQDIVRTVRARPETPTEARGAFLALRATPTALPVSNAPAGSPRALSPSCQWQHRGGSRRKLNQSQMGAARRLISRPSSACRRRSCRRSWSSVRASRQGRPPGP